MKRFSILIPTWNNLDFLKLCIRSIEQNSACEHEILIHVNDGSDGTLEWVRQHGYKYTHSEENIGVCWALNGLRPLVTTNYIVFMNDDMYVCPKWDSVLYEEIVRIGHNFFFLSSTMIQPKEHTSRKNSVLAVDYGYTPETFNEAGLLDDLQQFICSTDWQGSTNPPNIVHRDIWDLVGGYSIEYTPGMASDPDFSAKLWLAGVREFKGMSQSLVYHFMSKSVSRIVKNDGSIQFLRKYGITIRAFYENILHVDLPVTEKGPSTFRLKVDILRSHIKKITTICRNLKTKNLWDNLS